RFEAAVDALLTVFLVVADDHAWVSGSKGASCRAPSRSSRICTFCSAWLSAAWQSRVRPMPCSKQVSESSSDSSPLSRRSTSCCSSARDCSKSRAAFLRAMRAPVGGGSETGATLAKKPCRSHPFAGIRSGEVGGPEVVKRHAAADQDHQ